MKQTYIIKTWGGGKYNFYRVGCKSVQTCIKYLKSWYTQAKERNFGYLYPDLLADGAIYKIISTPDGYNEKEIVKEGIIIDLFK